MRVATFAGHRQILQSGVKELLNKELDEYLALDSSFIFYTGGYGEFDKMCASAIRNAKKKFSDIDIKLCLVLPYITKSLYSRDSLYNSMFDEIIVPIDPSLIHYKAAINQTNKWMVQKSDTLIAYVYREFGGAYSTLRYAKKLNKNIINLAEKIMSNNGTIPSRK